VCNSPLHCLGLAVTGKVVGATAFIASGRARTASEASPEATAESSTTRGTASSTTHSGVGAVAGQVASKTARVAASAGAGSAQAQSRAVSLDVSESLAVVALLRCPFVSPGFLVRRIAGARGRMGSSHVLSVVRGCGHPFDSWPGCLPVLGQRV
jgi:hypothetical protein